MSEEQRKEDIEQDTEIEFFRGSGPGGQHRNKKETGVRVRHIPTGIIVEVEETRSQNKNREIAVERLEQRVRESRQPSKPRVPTKPPKRAKEERLQEKHEQSEKKRLRKPPLL